jgi:hypothetical protein
MNEPHLGQRCVYRPRVPYGRQSELFCFVTRIIDAANGTVDLIAFPANSEAMHVNNVARQSDAIAIHCWEAIADEGAKIAALEDRIAALEKRLGNKPQGSQGSQAPLAKPLERV